LIKTTKIVRLIAVSNGLRPKFYAGVYVYVLILYSNLVTETLIIESIAKLLCSMRCQVIIGQNRWRR